MNRLERPGSEQVVKVLPSVRAISAEDWERLGEPRILFESRGWLSDNEASLAGEAVVTAEFNRDELESLIVWRVLEASNTSAYYNVLALLRRLEVQPPATADGWTLNCTGSGMHSPVLAAPNVAFDASRLRTHIEAASTVRGGPPTMCGFNFAPRVPPPGLSKAFAELGFQEVRGYRRAFLTVPEGDYGNYLGSLNSRRRWNARRDRRRFAETGQRISYTFGPAAAGEDLVRLQGYYRQKYGLPHDVDELRNKHLMLLERAGDDGLVIRSHEGERTTGFAMFFRMRSMLHALFAGFEPHSDRTGPYFECLFHAAIEWACANGITEIDYGIGATQAKAERGCRIEEVSSWYLPATDDEGRFSGASAH